MIQVQIPSARVPLMDPKTGYVSREWYLYWSGLHQLIQTLEAQIAALDVRVTALEPP